MDKKTKMCVDPGGSGAILSAGERGGPGPPDGGKTDNWHQTVEEVRHPKMSEGMGNELDMTPRHPYAQSTYVSYVNHVQ
jgi:hypothetical protein